MSRRDSNPRWVRIFVEDIQGQLEWRALVSLEFLAKSLNGSRTLGAAPCIYPRSVDWIGLSEWWLEEVRSDPAYEDVVTPLLFDVFQPEPDRLVLDLGCGEGRILRALRALGVESHGLDLSSDLISGLEGVVVARLPETPMRDSSYDDLVIVLTLEHIVDDRAFFREAARVARRAGLLAMVLNHPTWTAPSSTPVTDEDGEVLWRPGDYFGRGWSEIPAGGRNVVFHHRSMSALLNAAAEAGWALEKMVERPHDDLVGQEGIPRLLACRWRLNAQGE